MTYASAKMHKDDPGIGALERPEGQSIEQASIEILERRNRSIARRMFEILDNVIEREQGPYDEDEDDGRQY